MAITHSCCSMELFVCMEAETRCHGPQSISQREPICCLEQNITQLVFISPLLDRFKNGGSMDRGVEKGWGKLEAVCYMSSRDQGMAM